MVKQLIQMSSVDAQQKRDDEICGKHQHMLQVKISKSFCSNVAGRAVMWISGVLRC
jgi:hypothetical protein